MQDVTTSQKYVFAAQVLLVISVPMLKVRMCLFYLRIFYSDILGRRIIHGLLVILVGTMVPFFIEKFFTGKPLELYWEELRPADKCLGDSLIIYIHASMNLAVDIVLMSILPPLILNLKLKDRQKWALIGIVLVVSLVVVAGIIRTAPVATALAKYTDVTSSFDPPWDMYDVSIWSSTEAYITLICAATPGIKPLVSKILPKLFGTALRSRSGTTGGRSNAIELNSKLNRSTLGTKHFSMLKSNSTTNLTTAVGPYSEIHSLGRHDEESIDDKSIHDSPRLMKAEDGIMRNTRVVIRSEERA
jgi:hypothetical protein